MGEATGIAWTASSWSPWIGCTEVSPGCDHCYARVLDQRHRYGGATHWGTGVPRYRTKAWDMPLGWNRKAAKSGARWTVFPSLCDPFDNEVPPEWREDLYQLIYATPNLTWLLLTKRIGNAVKMLPELAPVNAPIFAFPKNVWLGASVVNQAEADRDIPKLLATPAAKRFVSYEPALGPVDFRPYLSWNELWDGDDHQGLTPLDWVIIGGESSQGGAKARPFCLSWARAVRDQCRAAGVPFFFKQAGSTIQAENGPHGVDVYAPRFRDRAGADPAEWPEDLRVQEFPA